ncbi:MAG TPA: hypothetical protein PLI16_06810, partial [Bacteroidales bacterium]|nr:hypothetical protein [Bacteroidales bacterium]
DEEGWSHTGDLGKLEPTGQLTITGRKKEIFKTSFGKYVNPGQIEAKFSESPLIDTMIVLGENQKYAAALIVPDFNDLKSWCENKGLVYTTNPEMINHPDVKNKYKKIIAHYNSFFGETEQIRRWEIMDSEWSVWSGELTPTLKIKRAYINNKYKDIISKLFEGSEILQQ